MKAADLDAALERVGLSHLPSTVSEEFGAYLELLLKWNARLNLTAIRSPEQIILRHFVESIFGATLLPTGCNSLLDFGSGAGFPGIPIAFCRPDLAVTLAESQNKKASFLREVVRQLGLAAEVFSGRVDDMPADARFDVVTLRAVDRMETALRSAAARLEAGGSIVVFTTVPAERGIRALSQLDWQTPVAIPGTEHEIVLIGKE